MIRTVSCAHLRSVLAECCSQGMRCPRTTARKRRTSCQRCISGGGRFERDERSALWRCIGSSCVKVYLAKDSPNVSYAHDLRHEIDQQSSGVVTRKPCVITRSPYSPMMHRGMMFTLIVRPCTECAKKESRHQYYTTRVLKLSYEMKMFEQQLLSIAKFPPNCPFSTLYSPKVNITALIYS